MHFLFAVSPFVVNYWGNWEVYLLPFKYFVTRVKKKKNTKPILHGHGCSLKQLKKVTCPVWLGAST